MPFNAPKNVKDTFCSLDDLPALPGVAIRILEKIKDPEAPLSQLTEILATDPPLSAKVLKVVNSPFFGLTNKITNLNHAVNLLGEESLKYIALSFSLINLFDQNKSRLDHSLFWKESLTCAVVSRLIAKELKRPDAEDLYFLGLIHNIGILVLAHSHPLQYAMVLNKADQLNDRCHIAENEIFGFNHLDVGAFLIDSWGFPENFTLPMLYHNHAQQIPPEGERHASRIRIIRLAVEISLFLHREEKTLRLSLIKQLINDYELTDHVHMESLLETVSEQIGPLLPLFSLEEDIDLDYLSILEESKKELVNLSLDMAKKMKNQQEKIDTLSILATQDGLTKLKNYQSFLDSLDREISSAKRYDHSSVLGLADLDAFKAVNDNYGHMVGDKVLQAVSSFFAENIRGSDVVARYGGEEFVFILSRTSLENGFSILDRLRENLSNLKIVHRGEKISVTMSVGVTAITPDSTLSNKELLQQADTAMYRAKNKGRNRTVLFK